MLFATRRMWSFPARLVADVMRRLPLAGDVDVTYVLTTELWCGMWDLESVGAAETITQLTGRLAKEKAVGLGFIGICCNEIYDRKVHVRN